MKVVLFTSAGFLETELFRYLSAHVLDRYPDADVVAVRPATAPLGKRIGRYLRKCGRLGLWQSLTLITSWPMQRHWGRIDQRETDRRLSELPRPSRRLDPGRIRYVESVNGENTQRALEALAPDVLVQIGAGLLSPRIFRVARRGTLNLHHGIAPLIRGMQSIYWAKWERKVEWLGATVHQIDEGIDTGAPLAYCRMTAADLERPVPELFAELTQKGVKALVECLERLERGEHWSEPVPQGEQSYRSTFTGWHMLALRMRTDSGRTPS